MLKTFGSCKPPQFFKLGDGLNFDPYYEYYEDGNKIRFRKREIPTNIPIELQNELKVIREWCFWMDESLFGLRFTRWFKSLFSGKSTPVNANNKIITTKPTNKSRRRFGLGIGSLISFVPFIGNYIILAFNLYILYSMLRTMKKFRVLSINATGFMIGNVLVDFGIGLIPFVGAFIGVLYKSNTRNLVLMWSTITSAEIDIPATIPNR
ncbi:hypothetical protein DAMA08_006030 [Martiniozyma asiatica (nom. inval.)]|nr:hypothetical protein DAMA08_006030 [Martiniozyma asiatica]